MESEIDFIGLNRENPPVLNEGKVLPEGGIISEVIGISSTPLVSAVSLSPEITVESRTDVSAKRRFSNRESYPITPLITHHFETCEADMTEPGFLPAHLYKKLAEAMERAFERQSEVNKSDENFLRCLAKLEENFKDWLRTIKEKS